MAALILTFILLPSPVVDENWGLLLSAAQFGRVNQWLNNNTVHLSCAHKCPEHSHDTY